MQTVRSYGANGGLNSEFEMEGYAKNGRGRMWSDAGALIFEGNFVDGLLEGLVQEWSETGMLIMRFHKRAGIYDGLYESWWDNGNRKESGMFVAGVRQKGCQWFDQQGEICSTY